MLLPTAVDEMPLLAITDAEKIAGYAAIAEDLKLLFEEHDVPKDVAEILGHLHVRKINVFARLEADETGLRRYLQEEVGLDGTGENRAITAMIVSCWDAARDKPKKISEHAAMAQADGRPKELQRAVQLDLRKTLVELIGTVTDADYPGYQYLNFRLEQLEEGELRAETLDEVISSEAELKFGNEDFNIDFTRTGGMKLKRHRVRGTMPAENDTEALRGKYRLMKNHWLVVRLRHPSHRALHDLTDKTFSDHVEFLLGEDVLKLTAKDDGGNVIGKITWRAFLHYEWEMRHWVCGEVNLGRHTLASAFQAVRNEQLLRTKFLITPLATSGVAAARSRPASSWETPNIPHPTGGPEAKRPRVRTASSKGKSKGDSKAKGKGKQKAEGWNMNLLKKWNMGMKFSTPACFAFNKAGCPDANCKWTHACAHCGDTNHGVEKCPGFNKFLRASGVEK